MFSEKYITVLDSLMEYHTENAVIRTDKARLNANIIVNVLIIKVLSF